VGVSPSERGPPLSDGALSPERFWETKVTLPTLYALYVRIALYALTRSHVQ